MFFCSFQKGKSCLISTEILNFKKSLIYQRDKFINPINRDSCIFYKSVRDWYGNIYKKFRR